MAPPRLPPNAEGYNTPHGMGYNSVRAIIITWQVHDWPVTTFATEIQNVVDFFRQHLGVQECVRAEIPGGLEGKRIATWLDHQIENFQLMSNKSPGKALDLVYYSGHGQTVLPREMQMDSGKGQSFEWRSLQRNRVFSGENDTLVILDCCDAQGAIGCLFQGCKMVFAACSANETTPWPGKHSFSHLFIRAGLCHTGPFSLQEWVTTTENLARAYSRPKPILWSAGDAQYQMCFNQYRLMVRLPLFSPAKMKENRLIQAIRELQERLDHIGHPSKVGLSNVEVKKILSDEEVTEPFNHIELHRAIRRMRDRTLEVLLLKVGLADPDDGQGERSS